jgi:hypothetical protein
MLTLIRIERICQKVNHHRLKAAVLNDLLNLPPPEGGGIQGVQATGFSRWWLTFWHILSILIRVNI